MGNTWHCDYTRPGIEPWWQGSPAAADADTRTESPAAA